MALSPKFSNIGGARTRIYVFQVGGVSFAASISGAIFGLKNASNWYVISTKMIALNGKFSSKIDCRGEAIIWFGRCGFLRKACFLPLNIYTRNSISSCSKNKEK